MHTKADIEELATEFEKCKNILVALGDENRQHLILEMMKMEQCLGVRVLDITQKTHLSRPAVSHHLQILKKAGILKMRREGTKNYYFFDSEQKGFEQLIRLFTKAKKITADLPDREDINM